jgi:hypothetical protein
MRAFAGDLLVVKGQHAGQPDLHVEVLEARGADGRPPWFVRWGMGAHEGLLFPGSEATIEWSNRHQHGHGSGKLSWTVVSDMTITQ